MELRQLRYFVCAVEAGSLGRAALELGVVTSALSQQISRLEGELATRLLQRTSSGVIPTDAGLAFFRQAQLALRHVEHASQAAQQARLSGHVSVGMAPTTASILGLPFMQAMRERYPDVRLHMVETLSGHLSAMLNTRQLDLAVVFQTEMAQRWSTTPLLSERLFVIFSPALPKMPRAKRIRLDQVGALPLILPTGSHGLRSTLNAAFARNKVAPNIVMEIDSLAMLMDAVRAGYGATIQPGAAIARLSGDAMRLVEISDLQVGRQNILASLSEDELSPAALAARVVLLSTVKSLVAEGCWMGATLHKS
ncbi:LysR substrate-binding domain-containing protein [Paralcaligenes sp. KSB-10]|uniref:LysR family transcriptional regulator n=1 Tax=Paralcaligenes sp. KSB-10 TaxID=2901142 RepID=UPI001E5024F3|nr:LysR substrate-binding domain-containing protein [Paralcaligenes sp. KSB-10]UHL63475.1 LysR substrate-binding domain-containing protein [Paralcaligenes sp. KSB-10]